MNCKLLILRAIYEKQMISQRELSKKYFISLGKVNQSLKELVDDGLVEGSVHYTVTSKGEEILLDNKVESAIILANDFGIKTNAKRENIPTGFVEIDNQRIIDRQIIQLNEVGIKDIYVVVGYQKEKYDYLIDKYNVNLIYNNEYKTKGSLAFLYKIKNYIKNKNCYLLCQNIYMKKNLFCKYEFEPYCTAKYIKQQTKKRQAFTTVKNEILDIIIGGEDNYFIYGFYFWTKEFSNKIMYLIEKYYQMSQTDNFSFEDVLVRNIDILPQIYLYKKEEDDILEINDIEDLRKQNDKYYGRGIFPIDIISEKLNISKEKIENIYLYKTNMNYNYWTYDIDNIKYITRVSNNEEINDINNKNEKIFYKNINKSNHNENENTQILNNNTIFYDYDNNYYKNNIKISLYDEHILNEIQIDNNNIKNIIDFYINFHNLELKYELKEISISNLIEKYIKLIKENNIDTKFVDYNINYEKIKLILLKIKNYNLIQKPINLHLYDTNIYKNNNDEFDFCEYDEIGNGDILDALANVCLKNLDVNVNVNTFDLDAIKKEYITDDIKKIYKNIKVEDIENLFMYKLALAAFLNVVYIFYKESVTIYDVEDYEMKQYRIYKNIARYLEENNLL